MSDKPKVQGEGDYEAARAYDAEARKHAKDKGAVRQAADAAKRALSGSEAEALAQAEKEGRARAKH